MAASLQDLRLRKLFPITWKPLDGRAPAWDLPCAKHMLCHWVTAPLLYITGTENRSKMISPVLFVQVCNYINKPVNQRNLGGLHMSEWIMNILQFTLPIPDHFQICLNNKHFPTFGHMHQHMLAIMVRWHYPLVSSESVFGRLCYIQSETHPCLIPQASNLTSLSLYYYQYFTTVTSTEWVEMCGLLNSYLRS